MTIRTFLLITSIVTAGVSQADEYHYNNLLVGGEAIGLAGAYTALYHDLSSLYYNPAGMAFAHTHTTASVNTFAWEQTNFEQVFGNQQDFLRDSFAIVPGFFALKGSHGQLSWGGFFAVTDYSKERSVTDAVYQPQQSPMTTLNEFAHINIDNSVYLIGLSGAYQLSEQWAVGSTVGLELQEFETVQGTGFSSQTPTEQGLLLSGFDASRRFNDTSLNIQPSLGLMWRERNWSLGASLSRRFSINRNYESISTMTASFPELPIASYVNSVRSVTTSSQTQSYPWRLALGAAYRWGDLQLSLDVSHYTQVKRKHLYTDDQGVPIIRELAAVSNYALGVKYLLGSGHALMLGVFTDQSNGHIDIDVPFERVEAIDLLGWAVAIESKFFGYSTTIGLYHKTGSGLVRVADVRAVEEVIGLPLYPVSNNQDVIAAHKQVMVLHISVDF